MENNQFPSKKRISIKEEKIYRKHYNDSIVKRSQSPKQPFLLDLEILPKSLNSRQTPQRVLLSIKPRSPSIRTVYVADQSRLYTKEGSFISSRLGIGDHTSVTNYFTKNGYSLINSGTGRYQQTEYKNLSDFTDESSTDEQVESSTEISICTDVEVTSGSVLRKKPAKRCYFYKQPRITMQSSETHEKTEQSKLKPTKADIATLAYDHSSTENSLTLSSSSINQLNKRIDYLERKLQKQEMVFRSMNPNLHLSSSDEENNESMRAMSGTVRSGRSYIEQYSHIPETSAFQRYAQQTMSPSKATTLEKEHNSEQYGRDFTAYDGITARGRRQCASVPCKRDDIPKLAAERVHKIRHKLNPVRDYRLMDTVHYLAQGEFAPRDDGIKLTPSREAVLSDIIYEDVCRTHWPNTRLNRRAAHPERCNTRCELQRLIDNLLRDRVAHVERRRRRHYRIVKLNHRHENSRTMGKTGDIIVASHKHRDGTADEITINDHNATSAIISDRRWEQRSSRRTPRSHDRFLYPEARKKRYAQDDCSPGPSCAMTRSPTSREPTCCYHTSNHLHAERDSRHTEPNRGGAHDHTVGSSVSTCKRHASGPRLVVKKNTSHQMQPPKESPDLEHYIILPTFVVRTPSNVKRQKKFNEMYHRILNLQMNTVSDGAQETIECSKQDSELSNSMKKDIGFNINITLSNDSRK